MTFADLLRRYRGTAELTQEALAERAGLSPDAIGVLERGMRRRPRPATVERLAAALGLDERQAATLAAAARSGVDDRQGVPRLLPARVAHFTGREGPAKFLVEQLTDGSDGLRVLGLTGMGGVGKTSLAVEVAHQLESEFPDGTLYLDLHAHGSVAPLEPADAARTLLRALGVSPADVPGGTDEVASRYRSELVDRELLLVLDNVDSESQVLPLLPGSPDAAVLVTSRRPLSGLSATASVHLAAFSEAEAVGLFRAVVGWERVDAEPEAANDIIGSCGGLPLAVRMAAGRLKARPAWSLRDLADRLADERCRLAELDHSDLGVRSSFELSTRQLDESPDPLDRQAARCFQRLGIVDADDFSVPVVARLLDEDEPTAEQWLERLADVCLLDAPAPGRYRLHDLLRTYARELATEQLSGPERVAAIDRVLGLYVEAAWQAYVTAQPDGNRLHWATRSPDPGGVIRSSADVFDWLDEERTNLLALVRQATADPGVDRTAVVQLAIGMFAFHTTRGHFTEWQRLCQLALAMAGSEADTSAVVRLRNDLGVCLAQQGDTETAQVLFDQSLDLARRQGDRHGEGASLSNLVQLHRRLGAVPDGVACAEQALVVYRELDDSGGQAIAHECLGTLLCMAGDLTRGLTELDHALAISRRLGHHRAAAICLRRIGIAHREAGELDLSAAELRESAELARGLGDRIGLLDATLELASLHELRAEEDHARELLESALLMSIEGHDGPHEAEVRQRLADLLAPGRT